MNKALDQLEQLALNKAEYSLVFNYDSSGNKLEPQQLTGKRFEYLKGELQELLEECEEREHNK